MSQGRGKHHTVYQTRRQPHGQHPDFQRGIRVKPLLVPTVPAVRSWWLDADQFYVNAKQEIGRMNQGRFGRLNVDFDL